MARQTTLGLFYVAVFLQAGAYGLTFMLPKLFETFGANEKVVGSMLLWTAFSTLGVVCFAGHFSDRFGRVRMLSFGCITIALSLALFATTSTVGSTLFLASLLLGFGWGLTYSLAPVALSALVADEHRIRGMAVLSVAVMAGFGLSPIVASFLINAGFPLRSAFLLVSALCAVSAVLFHLLITPFQAHARQSAVATRESLSLDAVSKVLRSPARLPIVMVCLGASVFAGLNNFQTVFAEDRGLNYSEYFAVYTITVVVFRLVLARFNGGANPYRTIAILQFVMAASVAVTFWVGSSAELYWVVALMFGLGYGVSYPILVAMAARNAETGLVSQTLQLFALSYFLGIFVFPLVAGWIIVERGMSALLAIVLILALIEATLALIRSHFANQPKPVNPNTP